MPKPGGPSKEARMARTDISWAGRLDEVAGGGRPGFMLGAPDAQAAGIGDGQAVTFSAWKRASYEGLAELLATATPRPVTPQLLERADLIAFESGPPTAGTCTWNQRNLYTSSEESSRYELDFTLDASLQVP
jgi:hypothetical protein